MNGVRRGAQAGAPIACERCATRFAAALTGGACPVCGLRVEAPERTGVARWLADPDNRVVVLVAGATVANLVVLLVLTLAVSRAG